MRAAAILYVAVMLGVIVLANAGVDAALPIWVATSFCLGWITRSLWSALLPLLAAAIAAPFGYPDAYVEGDPLPLWAETLLLSPYLVAAVFAGYGARLLYERFRASRA